MVFRSSERSAPRIARRCLALGRWRVALPVLVTLLWGPAAVQGAEPSTITLRDGSSLSGEVESLVGGVYTIRSSTLGTLTIRQDDVRSITAAAPPADAAPAGSPATVGAGQVDALQQRIAADPSLMRDVTALQDLPEVQAILNDPEIMDALRSGSVDVLLSSPKVRDLAADPRVQGLVGKLAQ